MPDESANVSNDEVANNKKPPLVKKALQPITEVHSELDKELQDLEVESSKGGMNGDWLGFSTPSAMHDDKGAIRFYAPLPGMSLQGKVKAQEK